MLLVGGEVVQDYEPTTARRNEAALHIGLLTAVPLLFGVFRKSRREPG